ncbi:MAG: 2OG-Fe(II) oxygenase superfamily protein [Rickettsiales bacterium]|jgi:alkylated DNA repair dioxygenase AlkB|nr:2OG-Fe(II) oxygenase superfamily protein [Rickettsiales bacterium]
MKNYPVQISLLQEAKTSSVERIPGLQYIPDYITSDQEAELLSCIDAQSWLRDLKRRVQHYGWKYDYKARSITGDLRLGPLPDWLERYCNKLQGDGVFEKVPDQVIINEYQPGQGIAPHIDCVPCFGGTIASISLGSAYLMEFTHANGGKVPVLLESRSLVILKEDARYVWKHGIPGRKTDRYQGQVIERKRRVSLTFRNVIL